ncbi:MAG: hypothetical protein EZS28_038586, partial [Streblomastix strix]
MDLPDEMAKKEEIPYLVNILLSGNQSLQVQVTQRLQSIALHDSDRNSYTYQLFLAPLVVMVKSPLFETSLIAWEALNKLVKSSPQMRDELLKIGFVETVRYSLTDKYTPVHVQTNLLDIIIQLLLNEADSSGMGLLVNVLLNKIASENEEQIEAEV